MLQTYTLAVPNIPLLALWHPTVQPAACYFWGGDATQQPFAAAGAVLQLTASGPQRFADLQQQANALWQTWQDLSPTAHPLSPKLLGGFGFWDQPSTQPQWRAFPAALFIMPQFTLSQVAGRTWLTVARCGESAAEPLAQLAARFLAQLLTVPLPETAAALSPALTVPDCTFDEWAERVAAATTQMQAGTYQKIVLSRTVTAYHQQRLNLATVLAQLPRQYPQCFHFAFTPPSSERLPSTFFAVSPELLARVASDRLYTMALAGSIGRGKTPAADAAQARTLLTSSKDRQEHQFVVDSIQKRLQPFCSAIDCPAQPTIFALPNIQHLLTPIGAALHPGLDPLTLLAALHPTPAVGGSPREAALAALPALEPHQRGWYAAPVGWLAADHTAEFAVALRSAVTNGLQTTVYAGAGMVATSDPASEWQETELKFKPILNILSP